MQCGGTQTRRQQERRGTPEGGDGAARMRRAAPFRGVPRRCCRRRVCVPTPPSAIKAHRKSRLPRQPPKVRRKSHLPRHSPKAHRKTHSPRHKSLEGGWVSMTVGELSETFCRRICVPPHCMSAPLLLGKNLGTQRHSLLLRPSWHATASAPDSPGAPPRSSPPPLRGPRARTAPRPSSRARACSPAPPAPPPRSTPPPQRSPRAGLGSRPSWRAHVPRAPGPPAPPPRGSPPRSPRPPPLPPPFFFLLHFDEASV